VQARNLFRWSGVGDAQESGERALPLLDQAVARDRRFALAHALASRVHAELYWFGADKRLARIEQARKAAERALQIQPDLGEAHVALGFYHYYAHRDYGRARDELIEARKTMPNSYEVFGALGMIDRREARWDAALDNLERARELDPRSIDAIWNWLETYTYLGRYAEADRAIDTGLDVSPHAHFFVLARAGLRLRMSGDTSAVMAALRAIPANFDPGGAVTTIAVRVSLMERDYEQAAHHLRGSQRDRHNDNGLSGVAGALDDYVVPRAWYEGLIARGRGDALAARQFFDNARQTVEADIARCAEDAKAVTMLGLIHAALGNRDQALRHAGRAVELLPVARDALDGALVETNTAAIYAQVGETDRAIEELQRLVALPGGPTRGLLRAEPEWDPLRGDARFAVLARGA
jgi:serine/threonine-protein kinase